VSLLDRGPDPKVRFVLELLAFFGNPARPEIHSGPPLLGVASARLQPIANSIPKNARCASPAFCIPLQPPAFLRELFESIELSALCQGDSGLMVMVRVFPEILGLHSGFRPEIGM
jgi:hypothetical protein